MEFNCFIGTSTLQRVPHEEPTNTLKIPPVAFTARPQPLAIKLPKVPSTRYESLFWFVIVLLISLILLNVILYFKLWTLENASHHKDERLPDFTMLKFVFIQTFTIFCNVFDDCFLYFIRNAPTTQEDWINLMQHQESLHASEMIRWQRILQVAIDMLRKVSQIQQRSFNIVIHIKYIFVDGENSKRFTNINSYNK